MKIFRRDDSHEFKPILAELEERPVSPLGRVVFWIVILVIVSFGIWICAGRIEIVVSARGKIFPEEEIKILQPLEAGVVSKISVKEGSLVRKGQVLMEIDPSTTQPELESLQENLYYLQLEMERLEAMSQKKPFVVPEDQNNKAAQIQRDIYQSVINSLQDQLLSKEMELKRLTEQIKSVREERQGQNSLLKIASERKKRLETVLDIITMDEYDRVSNDIFTLQSSIQQSGYRLQELEANKRQIKAEMGYIQESLNVNLLKELSEQQKQMIDLRSRVEVITFRNDKERITSPVAGHVNELFVHTIGGVVTPAQKLVSIVPINSPLIIKAMVQNKDIGFVKSGMLASIKVDAFNFQKYGLIRGRVIQVSRDSIEDERLGSVYEVYLAMTDNHLMVEGKKRFVSPGMSLTAEIKVGQRRIIEFFIYPLIQYLDDGLSVR